MRILQIVTQQMVGGVPLVAIFLAEELRKKGHELEVWFLYVKHPAYTEFPGVKVILDRQPSKWDYVKIIVKLWNLIRSYKPDALITHSHYANVLGQFAARIWGVPKRVAVQHNPLSTYPKIARWADKWLGALGFYSANVCVSQTVIDSATEHPAAYKSKLRRIYNGMPLLTSEPSTEIRASWNLPENAPLLLNVGRLAQQKNQGVLLEVLQYLPDAHLVLVGEGELRTRLQQQVTELKIEERVHFLGELQPHDVWGLFCVANIFVFPSLYEGMPLALIEAMRAGLPIVASDVPVMREVLKDVGIYIPLNNATLLAEAVQKILNSPDLANQMSQRSLERSQQYSLQQMIDAYESLLA